MYGVFWYNIVNIATVTSKPGYKRNFKIEMSDLSTSNFYPLIFHFNPGENANQHYGELDVSISSRGAGAADPWNQNYIHFSYTGNGWNDYQPYQLNIYHYGVYEASELTIGCIGMGTRNGNVCLWIRGGLQYTLATNYTPKLYTSGYTSPNDEVFSVGTNLYGGSNSYVLIRFTPDGVQRALWSSVTNP